MDRDATTGSVSGPAPTAVALALALLTCAPAVAGPDPGVGARITALAPRIDAVVAEGMAAFGDPGVVVGIVARDDLVFARGYGLRREGGAPVDVETIFQIGSTTKAFLATTMAIAVDRGDLRWDDRVIDLDPGFQLMDPWVTREFRAFDLLAQRSGLPAYVNDNLAFLGFDQAALIRSLRFAEPVTSFRTTFAYTNVTHLEAGHIVARLAEAPDWESVARREILDPLGMTRTSFTAEAIAASENHATGHVWTPDGLVEAPFTPVFPYLFAGAGALNSNLVDMARWVRLQLGDGVFDGKRIVSAENLAATRVPRVGVTDTISYAMGWVIQATPNGTLTTHGGATAYGSYVGLLRDSGVGVIVLCNGMNRGLPNGIGDWIVDRLLDNPEVDHIARWRERADALAAEAADRWRRPADARPAPPLAPRAGAFAHPAIGVATVAAEGDGLVMTFPTGAALRLDPWDGDVFAATLVPEGRFADVVANLPPNPLFFAQFEVDPSGGLGTLRLTAEDGQSYAFARR